MGLFDWFKRKKKKNEASAEVIAEKEEISVETCESGEDEITPVTVDNQAVVADETPCIDEDKVAGDAISDEDEIGDAENGILEQSDCCNTDDTDVSSEKDEAVDDNAATDDDLCTDENADIESAEATTQADEPLADDTVDCEKATDTINSESDFTIADNTDMSDRIDDIQSDNVAISENAADAMAKEDNTDKPEIAKGYTGRFEINRTKDGKKFFFNLYASNKVGIATSQMYSTAQNALNGVRSVITNAPKAFIEDQTLKTYETLPFPKWEIYIDNGGKYRFRLNATNGSCVCHSQGYTSKANCKNGIESIIRSSRNAEIDKAYLLKKD